MIKYDGIEFETVKQLIEYKEYKEQKKENNNYKDDGTGKVTLTGQQYQQLKENYKQPKFLSRRDIWTKEQDQILIETYKKYTCKGIRMPIKQMNKLIKKLGRTRPAIKKRVDDLKRKGLIERTTKIGKYDTNNNDNNGYMIKNKPKIPNDKEKILEKIAKRSTKPKETHYLTCYFCGKSTNKLRTSDYSNQLICEDCESLEKMHDFYEKLKELRNQTI